MKRYNPKEIEPKWQQRWEADGIYRASEDSTKPKRYVLEYFPYPSGAAMHVGHVRNYTIGDAVSRFHRMQGENVLHPMGWDSFGLPAENYAIKNNISPKQAIAENTAKFKQQLTQMGFSYDWSREIDSSHPDYYRWTQWFFKLLFDRGLAYQKNSLQWWCETDKTVLANEQVEAGKCWRCGNTVTKKPLKQWFFKITDYADRLVDDLDDLDWSDSIKAMQRNWIGKSKGAEVTFKVFHSEHDSGSSEAKTNREETINVFTTRADTLCGATFLVLAPEHELVNIITTEDQKSSVEAYVKEAQAKSDIERQETSREKTGVFTGAYAVNPINNEKIPIWIADYVLTGYGTGAIMAVPAHDERDFEFAKKFALPIREVVSPYITNSGINRARDNTETLERNVVDMIIKNTDGKYLLQIEPDNTHFPGGGVEPEDEDDLAAVKREMLEETGYANVAAIKRVSSVVTTYAYRITKQKNQLCHGIFYEVQLEDDSQVPSEIEEGRHTIEWVEKDEVAARLTWEGHAFAWQQYTEENYCYSGEGVMMNSHQYDGLTSSEAREQIVADLSDRGLATEKVNYKIRDWLISRQRYWGAPIPIVYCKEHGAVPVPEDQLPVELPELKNFQPTGEGSALAGATDWINTTCPTCGGPAERETDTMDGFACSSWYFLRFADPHNNEAPFSQEKAQFWLPVDDYIGGAEHAVMHLLYARMWTKVMFDAGLINFNEPFKALRNQGMILAPDGRKMSKSWGNVISPNDIIDQGYGADAIRLMELFIGPWNQEAAWSVEGMGGCFKFLQRVWTIEQEFLMHENEPKLTANQLPNPQILKITHQTIKKVSEDLHTMGFNTAIAALMAMTNELYKIKTTSGFEDRTNWRVALKTLVQLLAPFAPHITEELWADLGETTSVHTSDWPVHDEAYLKTDTLKIVVQVNGKVRATLELPVDSGEATITAQAQHDQKVADHLKGKTILKTIYIPGKLINFVV